MELANLGGARSGAAAVMTHLRAGAAPQPCVPTRKHLYLVFLSKLSSVDIIVYQHGQRGGLGASMYSM